MRIFKISYEDYKDYKNFCNEYLTGIYISYKNDKSNMQILLSKDNITIYNGKKENENFKIKINNLKKNNGVSVLFNESNGCLCTFFKNKNLAEYFEYQLKDVYNLKDIKGLINFVIVVRRNTDKLQDSKKRSVTITEKVLNKILLKRYNKNIEYMPRNSSQLETISNLKSNNLKEGNKKMKSFKFKNQDLFLEIGTYEYNNRLAVMCNTPTEPFSNITVNLPRVDLKSKDEAFMDSINKDYGLTQKLIDEGIIQNVIEEDVPYNMGKYDLVKFNMDKLKEYDPKGYENFLKAINYGENISFNPSI